MIIARAPYRVSFLGGSTDYPTWYSKHGGAVLTSTIDKYTHVCARFMPPYLGHAYRIIWSKFENVDKRADIQHPGVRGCLEYLGIDQGFEVNHAGDLPARSGLGSSSAFTVAMLCALHGLRHELTTKEQLAREAVEVEQNVLKETVGIQDQIECAHGGLNVIEIERDGHYTVNPLLLSADRMHELQSHLMLFFTGISRTASDIAAQQVENSDRREAELSALQSMVPTGARILSGGRLEDFGELLHDAWMLKRKLSDLVSTPEVDEAYSRATEAGAIGGKLLGAGGGGFLLIFARPTDQNRVRFALRDLIECPLTFERDGARVIHAS